MESGERGVDHFESEMASELWSKNVWPLALLLLCAVVVVGNMLVIVSVKRERVLQNATNFFIVSLAAADMLVAALVMPFSIYVLVNWGFWGLPEVLCDFYIALDVVCSSCSIFNLVAISFDRFYAVTSPIRYAQHKAEHGRAYVVITACWMASLAIGSPIVLGANHIPKEAYLDSEKEKTAVFVCAFYNPDFIIYSSLGSFFIPCCIMAFLYVRIFKALHHRSELAQRVRDRRQQQQPKVAQGQQIEGRDEKRQTFLDASRVGVVVKVVDEKEVNSKEDDNDNDNNVLPSGMDLQVVVDECSSTASERASKTCVGGEEKGLGMLEPSMSLLPPRSLSLCGLSSRLSSSSSLKESTLDVLSRSEASRRPSVLHRFNLGSGRRMVRKETKATQTLAVVLVCFLVCWSPFFTCNILNAMCIKLGLGWRPGDKAFLITTWLGYFNSCVNPLIYTVFNPEFRKAFKNLIGHPASAQRA